MARRSALLQQSELTRYAKGLRAAGVAEWRIVVRPDGSHEIVAGPPNGSEIGPDPDELLR